MKILVPRSTRFPLFGERTSVEQIRLAMARDSSSSMDEVEQWSKWALAQADRIDPAIGGRFLKAMQDE